MLAAMTKDLLIDGLEKQNIQPEKIGVSSEKMSEISRTITLAMVDDKKREQFADKSFEPSRKSKTAELAEKDNVVRWQDEHESQHVQVKQKQFERARYLF